MFNVVEGVETLILSKGIPKMKDEFTKGHPPCPKNKYTPDIVS